MTRTRRALAPGEAAHLARLPADHPERLAALEAVGATPELERALAEGARLQACLDAHPPAPGLDDADLAAFEGRVLAALDAEETPTSPFAVGPVAWLALAAAVAGWAWLLARQLPAGHGVLDWTRTWALAGLALAALALAVAAPVRAPLRGVLGGALGASGVVAWLAADPGATPALAGAICAVVELAGVALPLGFLAALHLRRRVAASPLRFAVVAAASALGVQSAVELGCSAPGGWLHSLATHGGGVALAAGLGLAVAAAVRRRATPAPG